VWRKWCPSIAQFDGIPLSSESGGQRHQTTLQPSLVPGGNKRTGPTAPLVLARVRSLAEAVRGTQPGNLLPYAGE